MRFIDLQKQQEQLHPDGGTLKEKIKSNISRVMEHGQYILGPEIDQLEKILSDYVGVANCVTTSSGTDALLISLMALNIKPGDEIITTPFSFIATAEVIALLGATPIYADIDLNTYNINPENIEALINANTKAIIPVSLYGQPANLTRINQIAERNGLVVIEDAAQSFGSTHYCKKSCGLSHIGITSFFPSKPFGCYGDGGACFTNNKELAEKIRSISIHGQESRYFHTQIGLNGRLDTMQAAVLLAKWDIFEREINQREYIASMYNSKLNLIGIKTTPFVEDFNTSVYAQYTIRVSNRSEVISRIKEDGIPSAVHYPRNLCQQPSLMNNQFNPCKDDCAHYYAKKASEEVLSLPMHPYLDEEIIDKVTISLKNALNS